MQLVQKASFFTSLPIIALTVIACGGDASPSRETDGASDNISAEQADTTDKVDQEDTSSRRDEVGEPSPNTSSEPECTDKGASRVNGCLTTAAGEIVTAAIEARVTVLAIEDGADSACGGYLSDPATPGVRYRLASADGQAWDFVAHIPQLPSDQVEVGDELDLVVAANEDHGHLYTTSQQTIVLAHDEVPLVFVATSVGGIPDFSRFGIDLEHEAARCIRSSSPCSMRVHDLSVRFADQDALMRAGSTVALKNLTFTFGDLSHPIPNGFCDAKSNLQVGGFARPPAE